MTSAHRARRYLIGAFGAVAILLAAPADVAVAASSECGRVTAYVLCVELPGYVILTKSDQTQAKVIVHAGTSSRGLSGYVCLGVDRDYLTGLLTPGTAGYLPEPGPAVLGYAASGLPNTSTSVPTDSSVPVLGDPGTALLAVLGVLGLRRRRLARLGGVRQAASLLR